MTIDSAKYARFIQQGQDAVRATVETWTATVTTATRQVSALVPRFDAEAAVDRYFDLNQKVLEAQRDVAKRLVRTGATFAAAANV
jgi:hypothetical protein